MDPRAYTFALGLEGTRTQAHYINTTPFGAYTFASGAPTANQQPTPYSQTVGVADTTVKDRKHFLPIRPDCPTPIRDGSCNSVHGSRSST
jgi:hypothetical protein